MSKGKAISVSSFFDLKAELAKQESELSKEKEAGKAKGYVVGGIKRPDKKPTVWQRQNKGVAARAQRDAEMAVNKPTLDSAREALERKAKLYDQLRRGKSGGLDDAQYSTLLVDFDLKAVENDYLDHSDDEDESRTVPVPPTADDPIVEYQDEFGRTRTARRSEVPRHLLHQEPEEDPVDDDPYVIRGEVNYFPTYQQSEERIAQIQESLIEDPLNVHYDASKEVRAKGAGFYQFSADEEERRRQMEELKKARGDTEKARDETGAEDPATKDSAPSRAMEKRKREIEERRKAIDAKRRKLAPSASSSATPTALSAAASLTPTPGPSTMDKADALAAALPADPFAMLENQSKQPKPKTDADDFLANLEKEMLRKRR